MGTAHYDGSFSLISCGDSRLIRTSFPICPRRRKCGPNAGYRRSRRRCMNGWLRIWKVNWKKPMECKRRGIVLASLMKLKQICNHPSQYLGQPEFPADDSGKFLRLAQVCEPIAERQEKALIFTQFQSLCEPLAIYLNSVFGRQGLILHGGVAVARRKGLVQRFQEEEGVPFFVISVKAGGTGLNLTAASHVIHFDRWWNPAVENQATDRAFRIGQKRNVLVHKFVCRGTLEERIDRMIRDKQEVADQILGGKAEGETMLTEMSDRELLDFVALDITRAADESADGS